MKVTVCFGPVKVIVPCGEGDLCVQELIERAVSRYRKASYKNSLDNVTVRWLETSEDNAILDPDDRVGDVCDDRDKLIAIFDEKVKKRPSNNGDGTSASSVGTASPDLFTNQVKDDEDERFRSIDLAPDTGEDNNNIVPLDGEHKYVSSGITRTHNGPHDVFYRNDYLQSSARSIELKKELFREQQQLANTKHRPTHLGRDGWGSREANFSNKHSPHTTESAMTDNLSSSDSAVSSPDETSKGFASSFQRNVNRKSLSAGHPMLYSWIDAQEKMFEDKYLERSSMAREEPAGSSLSSPKLNDRKTPNIEINSRRESFHASSSESEEVELDSNDIQNLGLQVRGYKTADGREVGLVIVDVAKSHVQDTKEGLQVADRITEVNGIDLRGRSNEEAEKLFNNELKSQVVKVKRTRSHRFVSGPPATRMSRERLKTNKLPENVIAITKEAPKPPSIIQPTEHTEKAIEAPAIARTTDPGHGSQKGSRIPIELNKGKDGLGFSITSRDVMTIGASRIFVKNILNRGAAIEDGRLEIGDEVVEVNGDSVVGKQQSEVAQMLRSAQGTVRLVVERTITEAEVPKQEEENIARNRNPVDKSAQDTDVEQYREKMVVQDSPEPDSKSEILSLTIPLSNLGSAGLGISVKGKTNGGKEDTEDLGIFVKTVLKGGAAAKDGRLQPGDQLICLDDTSLIGVSNAEAMETLRAVMQNAIKKGCIKIIVSRKSGKSLSRTNSRRDSLLPEKQEEPMQDSKTELDGNSQKQEPPIDLPLDKNFDNTYLRKPMAGRNRSPVRNQSYFKAVDRTVSSVDGVHQVPQVIKVIRKPPSDEKERPPRSVSVNSVELPTPQPTKSIYIEKKGVLSDSKTSKTDVSLSKAVHAPVMETKQLSSNPPPYDEAMHRKSSYSSSNKSGSEIFERPKGMKTTGLASSLSPQDETGELIRASSISSQVSIDSLMIGPSDIPFSRDAFGRLSMSERKGRAHLDATKSDFYTKLKKFRSMEDISKVKFEGNLSPSPLSPNAPTGLQPFGEGMRRSESVDTILSRTHDELEETTAFSRNAVFNATSPMVGPRATSPPAMKTSVKLRELAVMKGKRAKAKPRPFSCIVENVISGRSRSTAWNDSFRTAVDKTPVFYSQSGASKPDGKGDVVPITWTSNAQYLNEKQRKKSNGFLKGLGNIFKINKAKKQSPPSPEIMTLGRKAKLKTKDKEEALLDFPENSRRPKSLHEDVLRDIRSETIAQREEFAAKLHQREQKLVELKRELSQADRKPKDAPPSNDAQPRRREAKTSEGRHGSKEILNSLAVHTTNDMTKQVGSEDIGKSVNSEKPSLPVIRTENPLRASRAKQDSNRTRPMRPVGAQSSFGKGHEISDKKEDKATEKALLANDKTGTSRVQNPPPSKEQLLTAGQRSRLEHRQVSLPRQLILKKSDQNSNNRTTTQSEADYFRKISLEKQFSLIDHHELKKKQLAKEKLDISQISEKKGLTVSHMAKI